MVGVPKREDIGFPGSSLSSDASSSLEVSSSLLLSTSFLLEVGVLIKRGLVFILEVRLKVHFLAEMVFIQLYGVRGRVHSLEDLLGEGWVQEWA